MDAVFALLPITTTIWWYPASMHRPMSEESSKPPTPRPVSR